MLHKNNEGLTAMSKEKRLATAISELMKLTGESDPEKAIKKAVERLKGRKTTHSRILGTFYGIWDAMSVLREWEREHYERGLQDGYKLALSNEPEAIRKKKEQMQLKLMDKMDGLLDKLDRLMDIFSMQFTESQKKQIQKQLKTKPKFKVKIEG